MGCGCFGTDNSAHSHVPASTSFPNPPAIDPETLLKLGLVFCQIHTSIPKLDPKYHSFLLISDRDLHPRTELQHLIFTGQVREPIYPIDIREKEEKVVISMCLVNAAELRENLHLAFESLGSNVKGSAIVEFMQNSLGEESLFEGENALFFAEEFAKFCLQIKLKSKIDIVTDFPNLSKMLRLEVCKHYIADRDI